MLLNNGSYLYIQMKSSVSPDQEVHCLGKAVSLMACLFWSAVCNMRGRLS